jgi:hypothetical protein
MPQAWERAHPLVVLHIVAEGPFDTMSSAQARRRKAPSRESYRTLRGWALSILLETSAIKECAEHGHMRDQTDPEAWGRARELALKYPFRRATPAESIRTIDDVMRSIGDTCPDCQ